MFWICIGFNLYNIITEEEEGNNQHSGSPSRMLKRLEAQSTIACVLLLFSTSTTFRICSLLGVGSRSTEARVVAVNVMTWLVNSLGARVLRPSGLLWTDYPVNPLISNCLPKLPAGHGDLQAKSQSFNFAKGGLVKSDHSSGALTISNSSFFHTLIELLGCLGDK